MVDQLRSFAAEVTRVAREVGTEGKLGGQANVEGVAGTWKDLTESVNGMASNLTAQVRNIAQVTTAVARGDLSQKITVDVARRDARAQGDRSTRWSTSCASFAAEVTRVAREVGTEGRLGGQAERATASAGVWKDLTDNVNTLAGEPDEPGAQHRRGHHGRGATATSRRRSPSRSRGEVAELKDTINTMVDQLSSFAAEVTRVAQEVGTEGVLGGQAQVEGVAARGGASPSR